MATGRVPGLLEKEEVTAFLGRARYQRTPEATGSRNGTRPKTVQTAEGALRVEMPQIRGTAERFISRVFPDSRTVIRTRPLEALIVGGYVRGLSDRDIESLLQEAGLGQVPKTPASRICRELRARYKAFCARGLAEVELLVLFLDAVYVPTRPSGAKEGVPVAWGYTTQGQRVPVPDRQRCAVHRTRKESTCCFLGLSSLAHYGDSAGGRPSTQRSVCGVA